MSSISGLEFDYNKKNITGIYEITDGGGSTMINGVIKVIEKEGKDVNIELVNRYIKKYASLFLDYWMRLHSV